MKKYNLAKNNDNNKSAEVKPKARKRQYTLAYKKKIVAEAVECKAPGELMALLRREGLASSTVHSWRVASANGELRGSRSLSRGPAAALSNEQKAQLENLRKENAVLKNRLVRAEAVIDLQKKIAEVMSTNSTENSGSKQ